MRRLVLLLWLLLCLPGMLVAQVIPPPSGGGMAPTLPETHCVDQVGIGLLPNGTLLCGPVQPAMAPGLVPSGVDINAQGQVIGTHLPTPLPPPQGGTGLSSGTPGGLLYFSGPTSLASTTDFPLNGPLFGGGPGQPPVAGTISGTQRQLASVLGPHTTQKQLMFDADGNIVVSTADIGGGDTIALPVPVVQGGTGLTSGLAGGLLYFPTPTTMASSPLLALNAPLLGGGAGQPPLTGTRSGSTTELASVAGGHTPGKQLQFDALGNVSASPSDIGSGAVTMVFGRTGAVVAHVGDYSAPQVTNAADLTAANTFPHPLGQSMARLVLQGSVAGTLALQAPPLAETSLIVWPAGLTDFSATGGPGMVVRQDSTGAPFTVSQLTFSHFLGVASPSQIPLLQDLAGVLTWAKGGTGWSDTQVTGSTHLLATVSGTLVAGWGITVDAAGNLITTGEPWGSGGSGGGGNIGPGFAGNLSVYPATGTSLADSGIAATALVTAPSPLTANRLVQAVAGTRVVATTTLDPATICTAFSLCAGYQATLGFGPEDAANKSPSTALGTSNVLYPTQGAVKTYVDALAALKEDVANKTTSPSLGTSNVLYPSQGAVKGALDALAALKEDVANKSPSAALSMSTVLYPTQGAVKSYVDTAIDTRQPSFTWGAGLALNANVASTDSTRAGFLAATGTALGCGPSNQGKMQVLPDGSLQYCDGAVTAILHTGSLTPPPLTWNVMPAACLTDSNAGKLTVNANNEIVCASDMGGTAGAGGVTSVFSRTGAVVAQTGDYTAAQVTNAADLTAANVFPHASGQSMRRLVLPGDTSGTVTVRAPAVAGTQTVTLPLDSSLPGFLHPSTTALTCGPGTAGAAQVLDTGVLQYCDNAVTPALRTGYPLLPLGAVGTLQATDAANRLAAYAGTTCSDPNAVMQGMTGTGSALCTPLPDLTSTARVLLATPDARFPTGVNLGGFPSGVVLSTVSGSIAAITTVPAPAGHLVGTAGPQTLDQTRVNKRSVSLPTMTTPLVVNIDEVDIAIVSELNQDTLFAAPVGTATSGQWLMIQAHSTLPRLLTWDTIWTADVGLDLPTTTSGGTRTDLWLFTYNASMSKWLLLFNTQLFGATGVVAGNYTCPTITVNARGQLTAAANGTCGPGGGSTVAGVKGDVQFNLNGTQLGADTHDFAYDPATGALALARLQLGRSGSYYLFRDSLGHKNLLMAPSVTSTQVAWYLPPEGGDICTTKSTGCGSGPGGGVTVVGSPSAGQIAEWVTASSLQGVSVTGTGAIVRTTSPTLVTPTIAKLANLTSNGVVTTSGGDGTLGVSTATYAVDTGVQSLTSATTYTCARLGRDNQCKMTFTGAGPSTITIATSGTLQDGDKFLLRLRCTAGMQTIGYDTSIVNSANVTGPTSCPNDSTKEVLIGLIYSSDLVKLQLIASTN